MEKMGANFCHQLKYINSIQFLGTPPQSPWDSVPLTFSQIVPAYNGNTVRTIAVNHLNRFHFPLRDDEDGEGIVYPLVYCSAVDCRECWDGNKNDS